MTAADAAANPDIVAEALAQDPKSYLYFGFTTLQDKNPVRTRNSYAGAETRLQGTIRRGAEVTRFLAERDARLLFASDSRAPSSTPTRPASTAGWRWTTGSPPASRRPNFSAR